MNQGTVEFFNDIKGYGFIKNDDESKGSTFVHMSALNDGLKALQKMQRVSFDIEKDPKSNKDRAANVSVID